MMARFIATPPMPAVGKRRNGKTEYRASGPIIFEDSKGIRYTVPTGWRSDGASWPTWGLIAIGLVGGLAAATFLLGAPLWSTIALAAWFGLALPFWLFRPAVMLPAFVHDWACQQTLAFPDKAKADRLFKEAMQARGVPFFYLWPMYGWVRLRGQRTQWQQPDLTPIMDGNRIVGWS